MSKPVTLVWLRRDLRIEDNSALAAAVNSGGAVIPVFIFAPDEEKRWKPGAASRWWLHYSLAQLQKDFRGRGSRLILRMGPSDEAINKLIKETGAASVYWNRLYEPAVVARDTEIKSDLKSAGIEAESFNSHLLFEPWELKTGEGKPYQVFTPFHRACLALPERPLPDEVPEKIPSPSKWPKSVELDEFDLLPKIPWDEGMKAAWEPGSIGAAKQLSNFLDGVIRNYASQRDFPNVSGTSRLSPHLHFGEISPRVIWHAIKMGMSHVGNGPLSAKATGPATYLKELVWREFAHHLLYHFPHTAEEPLRPEFANFPWVRTRTDLKAWQRGQTGYPIVDAGMRELWATGWMHNRVRMIVASFLVKDLRQAWLHGADWFWDTLVDADLANNTLGWQWSAGCGADAAPYFRAFNPRRQSEKFDPDGEYIRRWVPELKTLPTRWIHAPEDAPEHELKKAKIELGKDYPRPIVDHGDARTAALEAFAAIKRR